MSSILAKAFGIDDPEEITREQKADFPKDGAFYIEDGNIGRVASLLDKVALIKEKVEHSHHYFNAPLYYIPTDEKVAVKDMYAITPQMMELWNDIEEKITDKELKNFLRIRFSQLIELDFKKTADYYVNAPDEVKDIFERLALVVIDYESAIKNGFFDVADSVNDAGFFCINGSYHQKNTEYKLKKYQNKEIEINEQSEETETEDE